MLTYSSGRTLKRPAKMETFMPRYIDEPKRSTVPSLDEQRDQFAAFAAKLKAAQKRS